MTGASGSTSTGRRTPSSRSVHQLACDRAQCEPTSGVSDDDLVRAVLGTNVALTVPVCVLAHASVHEVAVQLGISRAQAVRVVSAFELGRRGAWHQPRRGARCLDPATVYELMRDIASKDAEEFHVVLLDVRGRLLGRRLIARGSLTQCPVAPRDVLRPVIREGAHGVILVHNHPSGDPSPSLEDADLTERLRAAAELVGVVARDHVIVASDGHFSWVESGRWRR